MTPVLRLRGRELDLSRPVLMGIVNATPDSFSDPQGPKRAEELATRGLRLVEDGAAVVDVGGESGRTDTEAVPVQKEIERVVPVVERLAASGVLVSVDTWRAPVARAVLEAGAAMINDVSGLSDDELAGECADHRAALVITHTRAAPKTKAFPRYDDVVRDVCEFLDQRMAAARSAGVGEDAIVLDPGIDLAKSPAESIALLRRLPEVAALGRPLLLAVSRKDFVGALTGRAPAARDAGTLAAVGAAVAGGARIVRIHDVAGAGDYLRVHEALGAGADAGLALDPELRREVV
ncbi:MAG TPA: dihydropteroate synthase [Thermoleophilaceae bacterium]|nr:dihydropteroate synthase [Thermoleophilaceae bacterium]